MALKCQKIFITYGRFQPVTWGHENSFNAVKSAAQSAGCDYRIFISHTNDKKDNPLKQGDKLDKLETFRTFVKTENGYKVTGPEGYVLHKDGDMIKFVNRLEFAYNNFTLQKQWR